MKREKHRKGEMKGKKKIVTPQNLSREFCKGEWILFSTGKLFKLVFPPTQLPDYSISEYMREIIIYTQRRGAASTFVALVWAMSYAYFLSSGKHFLRWKKRRVIKRAGERREKSQAFSSRIFWYLLTNWYWTSTRHSWAHGSKFSPRKILDSWRKFWLGKFSLQLHHSFQVETFHFHSPTFSLPSHRTFSCDFIHLLTILWMICL